jgi:hypothetical protein
MSLQSTKPAKYTSLSNGTPSFIELVPNQYSMSPSPNEAPSMKMEKSLGKPTCKPTFEKVDFGVVLISFISLMLAIVTVTPHLSLAWSLGFEGQIIIIGFLLSVMNLGLKKLTPTLLLLIETRWGPGRLQNYDAILTNTLLASNTSFFWRYIILFFLFLPLVLSVGYKRFTGGTSSAVISNPFSGRYGLAAPPLGNYITMNNSIYYTIDANVPFLAASSDDSVSAPSIPTAYGYNTLLLDNTSAALLDMPLPDYVWSIQQSLSGSNYWTVSATVNATVSRSNSSIEAFRNSDGPFFNETIAGTIFSTFGDFNNWALGWLPAGSDAVYGSSVIVGHYYWQPDFGDAYINDPSNPQFIQFQTTAFMFNTRRERCAGTWQINRTAIVLLDGSCSGIQTNQTKTSTEVPFPLDALPVLNHALQPYSGGERNSSSWRVPAFLTSVATSYWARWLFMFPGATQEGLWDSELNYPATDEYIVSTATTLDATWLLFVLLAAQPFLTLFMFLASRMLYSTPIGNGFGLVAILSGIERTSLDILAGAGLSGTLETPVKLEISIDNEIDGLLKDGAAAEGKVKYTINGYSNNRALIKRRKVYV